MDNLQECEAKVYSLQADVIARGGRINDLEKQVELLEDKLARVVVMLQSDIDTKVEDALRELL